MKPNIAVVGCGYWGENLVRNFAELGVLHTICDVDDSGLAELKSLYPRVSIETDYQQVLRNAEIEGVAIATPSMFHYSLAREALLDGKDAFVEKPLALGVEEGRELVELAAEREKVLMVGHLLEYHPAVDRLKELVDGGELGKLQYICSNRLNLGRFPPGENVLWRLAPHDISVILLLLGGEMPLEVSTHGGYYLHQDIADIGVINMSFQGGVKAHIFVSRLHPYKEQKLVVIGDKKMAEFNNTSPKEKLRLFSHKIEWVQEKAIPHWGNPEAIDVSQEEPLKRECQDFIECIQNRKKPKADGYKGLQVLEVLSHCQNSLEEGGRAVSLGEKERKFSVHETSIVEEACQIGSGTRVWHFCHIMPHVTIGKNCVIGQNAFIGEGVKIGNNVKIENNVSIFEEVTLEDDVLCGPSCVFTNIVYARSFISRKNEFKTTLVKKGASVGANATIICGHTIGRYAYIGAGAVVTKDVPDHALVYGNPARICGWACICGVSLRQEGDRALCPECGKVYELKEGRCSLLDRSG
jgi:UDP-2-acetamido-3-amino-2,3-dideoxy-glucuronate N-acetyltransferase